MWVLIVGSVIMALLASSSTRRVRYVLPALWCFAVMGFFSLQVMVLTSYGAHVMWQLGLAAIFAFAPMLGWLATAGYKGE